MDAFLPKVALLAVAACATLAAPTNAQVAAQPAAAATAPKASAAAPAPAKRNPTLITTEAIRESSATTAYEVVSRLRPAWLRNRGMSSFNREGTILVYRDGLRIGSPEALRQIDVSDITSISYMDGMEATQRFGTDHGNGVIAVTTRR